MPTYVVIAENYAKRADRLEARSIGFVSADSMEQARRLTEATYPGLTLTIRESSTKAPTTPQTGCGGNQ